MNNILFKIKSIGKKDIKSFLYNDERIMEVIIFCLFFILFYFSTVSLTYAITITVLFAFTDGLSFASNKVRNLINEKLFVGIDLSNKVSLLKSLTSKSYKLQQMSTLLNVFDSENIFYEKNNNNPVDSDLYINLINPNNQQKIELILSNDDWYIYYHGFTDETKERISHYNMLFDGATLNKLITKIRLN
jgi:hypothetical protein